MMVCYVLYLLCLLAAGAVCPAPGRVVRGVAACHESCALLLGGTAPGGAATIWAGGCSKA